MAAMGKSDEIEQNIALEALAKKCIHDHRHPIVKVYLPSQKLFFAAKNDEEKNIIKEHQDQFYSILEHQRVEKRASRGQAIWLDDKYVAKVTKVVKNLLKYFGYQNKEGVFLYPEEMLYLLETNKLEVTFGNGSLSIEKAYEVFLKTPGVNLSKYRVYKKLAALGYKLVRYEQIQSKKSHRNKKIESKRTLDLSDCCEMPECKKTKQSETSEVEENKSETDMQQAGTSISKAAEYISNIFDRLKANMPRDCANEVTSTNPDYCVWSPNNMLKPDPDYNLFIWENNIMDGQNFSSNSPNIYALCIDDVSFYRCSDVHLPYI